MVPKIVTRVVETFEAMANAFHAKKHEVLSRPAQCCGGPLDGRKFRCASWNSISYIQPGGNKCHQYDRTTRTKDGEVLYAYAGVYIVREHDVTIDI